MTWILQKALCCMGGRRWREVGSRNADDHSNAALVGLALIVACAVSFWGWWLWLLNESRPFPEALALFAALAAAALFRELTRARETATLPMQRAAIKFVATLMLAPGAWVAVTKLPTELFNNRVEVHRQLLVTSTNDQARDAALRTIQLERLRGTLETSVRELSRLEPARLAWSHAIDRARSAAERCANMLHAHSLAMPQPPYTDEALRQLNNLQGRSLECRQLDQAAEQVKRRFGRTFQPKLSAEKQREQDARVKLELAEHNNTVALEEVNTFRQQMLRPCAPIVDCSLQRAIRSGAASPVEIWGTSFLLLLFGFLPALLINMLPPDGFARDRHLRAVEDEVLSAVMADSSRKALSKGR